jgi:hypothetical protein
MPLANQSTREVKVLSGKILMDKKQVHASWGWNQRRGLEVIEAFLGISKPVHKAPDDQLGVEFGRPPDIDKMYPD